MTLNEWLAFTPSFEYPPKWLQCCLSVTWLVLRETAAISAQVLCTQYNHAQVYSHFIRSHACRMHVCLVVTCHLHFWQNDRSLLRATAVTWGWNGYRNKSQHRKLTLEENILSRRSCKDSNPWPFNHESGTLTTKLSPLKRLESMRFEAWREFKQRCLVYCSACLSRRSCMHG